MPISGGGGGGSGGGQTNYFTQIPIWSPDSSTGTWSWGTNNSQFYNGAYQNSVGSAINDQLTWNTPLLAGTYTIGAMHIKASDGGIATFKIDGTTVGTIDMYNAGLVFNSPGLITGVTVPATGLRTVQMIVLAKNGASTSFIMRPTVIYLVKTG